MKITKNTTIKTAKIGRAVESKNLITEKINEITTPVAKRNIGAKSINNPKANNPFIPFILI